MIALLIAQVAFVPIAANLVIAGGFIDAGILLPDAALTINQSISSPNGLFKVILQDDGNLVEYEGSRAAWASGTHGKDLSAIMQNDGNLVIYSGTTPEWTSNTAGNPGDYLTLANNGELTVDSTAGTVLWGGVGILIPDATLAANQSISSPNGLFKLTMQNDGNLVEYDGSTAAWASGTHGKDLTAVMESDGNLVIYSATTPEWTSNTSGNLGDYLTLANDGELTIDSEAGTVLWGGVGILIPGATLAANQSISSLNGLFKLTMQNDGNLVEYDGSSAAWSSGTHGKDLSAIMQNDGNLVIYSGTTPEWTSNTAGNPGDYLTLADNGELAVDSAAGTVLWQPSNVNSSVPVRVAD
jgi:regulator of extracellular matrix RemA (YlzA/DUF370 family)